MWVKTPGVGGRVRARRAADRALVDVDDLVELVQRPRGVVRARRLPARRAARRRSAGSSVSMTSVDLPEPETPVTQVKHAERESARRCPCRLCCRAPRSVSAALRGAAARRHRDRRAPERYCAGQAARAGERSPPGVPAATTSPPCTPAPGPMSMTWSAARMVSSSCSTTSTVLPRSRSSTQRLEQAGVVALVQADRRLVEDVEHAHQRASRSGSPAGCAAPRRPRAWPPCGRARGSRARR